MVVSGIDADTGLPFLVVGLCSVVSRYLRIILGVLYVNSVINIVVSVNMEIKRVSSLL